jgi:hypothetical protein
MKSGIFFTLCCLFLVSLSTFAQERFVMPVDEAKKDASFFAFREKLVAAVKKKDSKFVLGIVDPKIKNGFGGNDGLAEFKKQWKINDPNSELWKELLTVLTHGGTFDKRRRNSFYAPYLFTGFPEDTDAFDHQAIFGEMVNLRAQPDTNAPVVATLSYNIVKVDYSDSVKSSASDDDYSWLKIETLGGKKGFVKAEFVRSSIDYRAGFEKKKGKWLMVFFLAGD